MDKTNAIDVISYEIDGLLEKPLTPNTVDLLFKLTSVRTHLINTRNGANNGVYDRDINELLAVYINARKVGIEANVTDCLKDLLAEISDLVIEIYNTAQCQAERDIISDALKKMQRH